MRNYVKKKVPLSKEQVQAIPPADMEMVFGKLADRLAAGKSTEGTMELLAKLAQKPEKINLQKPYNLGGYSNRYTYYKKLEKSREWQRETPTDFSEFLPSEEGTDDTILSLKKDYGVSVDALVDSLDFKYWVENLQDKSFDIVCIILYDALDGNETACRLLNRVCNISPEISLIIKSILEYPIQSFIYNLQQKCKMAERPMNKEKIKSSRHME